MHFFLFEGYARCRRPYFPAGKGSGEKGSGGGVKRSAATWSGASGAESRAHIGAEFFLLMCTRAIVMTHTPRVWLIDAVRIIPDTLLGMGEGTGEGMGEGTGDGEGTGEGVDEGTGEG